ncbi:MAG: hypothetical protein ABS76_22320 [Pelagibacterium sp. SCN 64-44]|nr:MAG: hypothetical protein ABS76_22320 [Pelagibacterium sp. SCN 64-44]
MTLAPLPPLPVLAQETVDVPLPRPRPDRSVPAPAPASEPENTAATEAIAALADVPQDVTLSARITESGAPIPDGLIWRVFDGTPDANGEMALVAKAETGTANLQLRPGEYMVHVAYGQAQVSESLSIVPGNNQLDIVLDAGALRLNSAVTGDIPISPGLLRFDILTAGTEASRVMVASDLPPNEIVTLNAGTYHIVSHFGDINAVVRADLRVEPGQLTDATLYHHAGEVSFKLVSEEGGEAIADVEWTVKTSDGATIFTARGAFPSTVLAEGEYLVLAKVGDQVYNREVQIQPGSQREIEVLSSIY